MYEHMTYEKILENILKNVPTNVDKREGSVIYDAIAPCALELAHTYIEFDKIIKESFADSASREYLIRRAKERDIEPIEATYAYLKGVFNIDVPINSRFSLNGLNYEVVEKIGEQTFKMRCETAGSRGNKYFGVLIPIDYIQGLEKAELTELLIPAEDEEATESLRMRYFKTFESESYGGNVQDYLNKTNALQGVGASKVTPVWAGGGTVKVTILDSEHNKATLELISFVQETLDTTKDGKGLGIAPIGHIVTVDTVTELYINIKTSITFENGITFDDVQDEVNEIVSSYLLNIRKEWGNKKTSVIRIAQIESDILNLDGVVDIMGTTINGSSSNIILGDFEIPIIDLGGVVNE